MPRNKSGDKSGTIVVSKASITYEAPSEIVAMNKYHIQLVLERVMGKPRNPTLEHVLIGLAFFMGVLLAWLPRDFKDFLGIRAEVLEASLLLLVILSGIGTVVLFILWLRNRVKYPRKSSDDIVKDICDEIAKDRDKAIKSYNKKAMGK